MNRTKSATMKQSTGPRTPSERRANLAFVAPISPSNMCWEAEASSFSKSYSFAPRGFGPRVCKLECAETQIIRSARQAYTKRRRSYQDPFGSATLGLWMMSLPAKAAISSTRTVCQGCGGRGARDHRASSDSARSSQLPCLGEYAIRSWRHGPLLRSRPRVAWPWVLSRATKTIRALFFGECFCGDLPMPDVPPVMTTVLPLMSALTVLTVLNLNCL